VRTSGRFPDGRDLSREKRAQGFAFGPDSDEAEFMPGLQPQSGELLLNKPASGIFTGTGLDDLLRNLGVENLVLAGISYDGAIQGSIRSISDRGYGLIVVPDACATYTELRQKRLWEVESGVIQVKDVAETIVQLNAL
jgi:nicotinamidase-related amidase